MMYETSKKMRVNVRVINLFITFILCKLGYESKELFTSKARVTGSSPVRGTHRPFIKMSRLLIWNPAYSVKRSVNGSGVFNNPAKFRVIKYKRLN